MKSDDKKFSIKKAFFVSTKILFWFITAFLVFVAAVMSYDKYVKKSVVPSFFGNSILVVATPSMSGEIDAGDMIIIKRSDEYSVGDVITYIPAADVASVTHRIVRIEGEKYYTKGDANQSEDPDPVFETQIAGKVTGKIPKLGIVIEWLRSWQGIAFLIAVGAVVLALMIISARDVGQESNGE